MEIQELDVTLQVRSGLRWNLGIGVGLLLIGIFSVVLDWKRLINFPGLFLFPLVLLFFGAAFAATASHRYDRYLLRREGLVATGLNRKLLIPRERCLVIERYLLTKGRPLLKLRTRLPRLSIQLGFIWPTSKQEERTTYEETLHLLKTWGYRTRESKLLARLQKRGS